MTNIYSTTTSLIRSFFENRGLTQIDTNSKLSILAACEDPTTIVPFIYSGEVWPLPQTGQMHLEDALLNEPDSPGFFCMSTSYRQEPKPIKGRHEPIFPMAEFEIPGDIDTLEKFERDLMDHLGFGGSYPSDVYANIAEEYHVKEITAVEERLIEADYGDVFFLKYFPNHTSPFWNMKNDGTHASKIDVIIKGVETIGSAERSCDPDEMYRLFHEISDGLYVDTLFAKFTEDRVIAELLPFLEHNFFPRCGGGIGITRMMKALEGKI